MVDTVDIGECALFLKILLGKAEAGFVKNLLDLNWLICRDRIPLKDEICPWEGRYS
jgi:hypothetical protein